MNPHNRLIWALGTSLVVWAPAAVSVATGRLEAPAGGIAYLGALGLAWFGTGVIAHLMSNYRAHHDRVDQAKARIEAIERASIAAADAQQRRKDDKDAKDAKDAKDDATKDDDDY